MVRRFFRLIYILVFFSGILLVIKKDVKFRYNVYKNELKIEEFYNNDYVDKELTGYIGILKIDKINLYQGFYDISSKYNDVDKNIMVHEVSNYPDVVNGNLILLAHSGNSAVSYFRDLDKLDYGDIAFVIVGDDVYTYKLVNIYELVKNGKVFIDRDNNVKTLTLITCSRVNLDKQVIYIFYEV